MDVEKGRMNSNHKLTAVLEGRSIRSTSNAGGVMTVGFDDGSTLTVQTGENGSNSSRSGTVEKAQQTGTSLELIFTGGGTLLIPLAEETSSVMVRAGNGSL